MNNRSENHIVAKYKSLRKQNQELLPGFQIFLFWWACICHDKRTKLPYGLHIEHFLQGQLQELTQLEEVALDLGNHFGINRAVPFQQLLSMGIGFISPEAIAERRGWMKTLWSTPDLRPEVDWPQLFLHLTLEHLTYPSTTRSWGDPIGLSDLSVALVTALYPNSLQNIYLPFANGSLQALKLWQLNPSYQPKMWVYEQMAELYLLSLCSTVVFGWNQTKIDIGPYLRVKEYVDTQEPLDALLAILPVRGDNPYSLLQDLWPNIQQSKVSVLVTSSAVLFAGSRRGGYETANLRTQMLDSGILKAMVLLPSNQRFHTNIRMVMLVFDTSQLSDEVMVINAEYINQAKTRYKNLEPNDIEKIVSTIQNRKEVESFSKVFKTKQLYDAQLGMNISTLVPSHQHVVPEKSLEQLTQEVDVLESELTQIRGKLDEHFKNLLNL